MTFGVIDGLTKQYILSCNMQSWLHSGQGYVLYYKVTPFRTYLNIETMVSTFEPNVENQRESSKQMFNSFKWITFLSRHTSWSLCHVYNKKGGGVVSALCWQQQKNLGPGKRENNPFSACLSCLGFDLVASLWLIMQGLATTLLTQKYIYSIFPVNV